MSRSDAKKAMCNMDDTGRYKHRGSIISIIALSTVILLGGFLLGGCVSQSSNGISKSTPRGLQKSLKPPQSGRFTQNLLFGIAPTGQPQSSVMNELHLLANGHPFLLHIYTSWHKAYGTNPPWLKEIANEIVAYAKAGFQVELVLRYNSYSGDATGYAAFVAAVVRYFAQQPALSFIQVTNEPNVPLAPATSDGAYPNVLNAVVDGVEAGALAAKSVKSKVKLGFNISYMLPQINETWFTHLDSIGGTRFARDLSWVGVDIYPGTYYPSLPSASSSQLPAVASQTVEYALNSMRLRVFPIADIAPTVQLQISEIGFATSTHLNHTDAEQAILLKAFVQGACKSAQADNVSAFEWFDLTDASKPTAYLNNPSLHLPWRFGLLRYNLTPKPAFMLYSKIIANGCQSVTK
ncbi:MAG: hypothetical protein M1483_05935 [Actinobacteria bacterium]|nr:hypothetical protein [Actinomycetota bacterium]MCL6105148.1 hypothetical protein [Actinomycetota bacterium]